MNIYLFSASWCAPCQQVKKAIEAMPADKQEMITIFNADADDDEFMTYSIRAIPTMIVFQEGEEIERHTTAHAIMTAIRKHLGD